MYTTCAPQKRACIADRARSVFSSPAHGQVKLYRFTLIELLVLTAQHCRDFISNACIVSLQNTPLFLKAKGSAECGVYGSVRMGTENYGASAPQQTTCAGTTKNTPLFLKAKGSAECGVYGYVRMGTENYGASAPQQTACVCNTQNTPLFFESERGFGGKRKPSFPVKRKFSLSPKLSPFTLIELLVSATC